MKTVRSTTTLAAVAAIVCPQMAAALSKVPYNAGALLSEQGERELMSFTVIFEECLHKPEQVCKDLINADLAAYPELFEYRTSFNFETSKIREGVDDGYYLVGLRTNLAETGVTGILGDGMVFYPFPWCVAGNGCVEIGPWDCDVGTPLTVEQCCNMIQASVPDPDVNGNMLDCYPDYPVGSVSNPTDYGRVSIATNAAGIVVHVPRNE